jgi:hypothetical protein
MILPRSALSWLRSLLIRVWPRRSRKGRARRSDGSVTARTKSPTQDTNGPRRSPIARPDMPARCVQAERCLSDGMILPRSALSWLRSLLIRAWPQQSPSSRIRRSGGSVTAPTTSPRSAPLMDADTVGTAVQSRVAQPSLGVAHESGPAEGHLQRRASWRRGELARVGDPICDLLDWKTRIRTCFGPLRQGPRALRAFQQHGHQSRRRKATRPGGAATEERPHSSHAPRPVPAPHLRQRSPVRTDTDPTGMGERPLRLPRRRRPTHSPGRIPLGRRPTQLRHPSRLRPVSCAVRIRRRSALWRLRSSPYCRIARGSVGRRFEHSNGGRSVGPRRTRCRPTTRDPTIPIQPLYPDGIGANCR